MSCSRDTGVPKRYCWAALWGMLIPHAVDVGDEARAVEAGRARAGPDVRRAQVAGGDAGDRRALPAGRCLDRHRVVPRVEHRLRARGAREQDTRQRDRAREPFHVGCTPTADRGGQAGAAGGPAPAGVLPMDRERCRPNGTTPRCASASCSRVAGRSAGAPAADAMRRAANDSEVEADHDVAGMVRGGDRGGGRGPAVGGERPDRGRGHAQRAGRPGRANSGGRERRGARGQRDEPGRRRSDQDRRGRHRADHVPERQHRHRDARLRGHREADVERARQQRDAALHPRGRVWARVVQAAGSRSVLTLESNDYSATARDGLIGAERRAEGFVCWTRRGPMAITNGSGQTEAVLTAGQRVWARQGWPLTPEPFVAGASTLEIESSGPSCPCCGCRTASSRPASWPTAWRSTRCSARSARAGAASAGSSRCRGARRAPTR